jgi:hypothetical protein
MIYCNNCGAGLQNDEAFCPECGTPASAATSSQNPPNPAPESSITMAQIEESKFFQFSRPFIDSIDQGKFFKQPFRWIYIIFAVLNLLAPIVLLILLIDNKDILYFSGFAIILAWLFIAFTGWIGFQLWWNRKSKINRYVEKGDDFLAIPTFSHFIQTLGEWYGITIALLGFGLSLCGLIATSGYRDYGYGGSGSMFTPSLTGSGLLGLIVSPVVGFFIIVFSRFIAEGIRSFAAIANNTKKK